MKRLSCPTLPAVIALILLNAFLTGPLHAAMNDKRAIAKAAGKYKGFWNNQTAFPGTGFFPTDDPLGSGDFDIEGSIRLSAKPKKLQFTLPATVVDGPTVQMRIKKTMVRRGGKFIKHKGTGSQDQSAHFGAGADLTGTGDVKLIERGKKFKAKGKYSGSDATPVIAGVKGDSPTNVTGSFSGKG